MESSGDLKKDGGNKGTFLLTANLNATNKHIRHLAVDRLDCVLDSFGGAFPCHEGGGECAWGDSRKGELPSDEGASCEE